MDEVPSPSDLQRAGHVAQSLAYVSGLAGVIAGAIIFQDGQTMLAVAVWVVTFAMGVVLMIAAFLVRGLAGLIARIARIESDLAVLVADSHGGPRGPWRRGEPG